jgi:UDP-3-O-[3-hydroxymyristoyl] N-acetylglucosamine deacetylase/3-hydroxyacyl-[acyl-carrier-protein] dehydratase
MTSARTARRQRTIAREAEVRGVGFVTEADVRLRFLPAEPETGLKFRRVDLPGRPEVPAHVQHVTPRPRRTTLERGPAVVEMVEHVLAALAGLRIDNCVVEIDAAETPGCDGSSRAFVEALAEAGAVDQDRPRPALLVDRPITVRDGDATLTALPAGGDDRLVFSYHLDYPAPVGRQSRCEEINPDRFRSEIAPSRTFLLAPEADAMRRAGLGRRISESDLLIFGDDGPINNPLRYPDECVRHKLLDMVGDLALAGVDLVGHVVAHRSGHKLNAALVRALLGGASTAADPAPTTLDIRHIMRVLPHRYPFLLIDRVTALDPARHVVAIKNVTINEPFFPGHWPDRPIMPGVLIVEAMAQAAGVLVAQHFDARRMSAVIAAIDGVKLRRPVVPGDQLRLEVHARRFGSRVAVVHAEGYVEAHLAAEAEIRFAIIDREQAA